MISGIELNSNRFIFKAHFPKPYQENFFFYKTKLPNRIFRIDFEISTRIRNSPSKTNILTLYFTTKTNNPDNKKLLTFKLFDKLLSFLLLLLQLLNDLRLILLILLKQRRVMHWIARLVEFIQRV